MSQLAADASYAVSDLLDETEWDVFEALQDIEKVQWRYCHADCDDFALALSEITGWPVIAVSNPDVGPIHRLVESPDGQMLDVMGWVSAQELMLRYKLGDLTVHRSNGLLQSTIADDEEFHPVLAAILQLPTAPFNTSGFQEKIAQFAIKVGLALPT